MLDLQEVYQRQAAGLAPGDPLYTSRSLSSGSVRFAPALGSLAARINAPSWDLPDPEWDDEAEEGTKSGADGELHDATAAQDSVAGSATVDTA